MSRAQWKMSDDPELLAKAEELKSKVMKLSVNGKIGCAQAFEIAKEEGLPIKKVGYILNILNLKIGSCQLGCFE